MKRKVIQLAEKTLVVSLPSKWVKQQGIKKGEEVDVEPKNNTLLISTQSFPAEQKKTDVSGLNVMLGRYVGALYKAGYDSIEMRFKTKEQLETIQNILMRTCIGLEITEQGSRHIIAKEISKTEPEEFEGVLRRLFLFLISVAEDSVEAIKNSRFDEVEKITLRDDNINRFADFCRRIINKKRYDKLKESPLYFIVEELEKVGDNYRDICRHVSENHVKISRETERIFGETNAFLREFYELFYNFDFPRLEKFGSKKKPLTLEIRNAVMKAGKEDIPVLIHLYSITEGVFDMNGPLIAMNC